MARLIEEWKEHKVGLMVFCVSCTVDNMNPIKNVYVLVWFKNYPDSLHNCLRSANELNLVVLTARLF